jgi:glycine cleavage system protein P-like pyridoxal-binding family
MKYSKKQIKRAFLKWSEFERLHPTQVTSKEETNTRDVDELADELTSMLIDYIKK